MFGRRSSAASEPTIIGRGSVIEGVVRAQGRVQVDGRIEGTLEVDGEVSVGPNGSVQGTLIADQLAVGGSVSGKITARTHLQVLAGGSARGEVHYGTLQVDRGGVIDGTTQHGEASAAAKALPSANDADTSQQVQVRASQVAKLPPPPLPTGNGAAQAAAS